MAANQKICTVILLKVSAPFICPVYIRNGVFCMEEKGRAYIIVCKDSGKKGMGIIEPEKNSVTETAIIRTPLGDKV